MTENHVYETLAGKFNHGQHTPLFHRLLRKMLTPEDARLLLALPATPDELASKLGQAPDILEKRLGTLVSKGVVVRRRRGYALPQNIPHLHDGVVTVAGVDSEVLDLWREFREAESDVWVGWLTEQKVAQFRVLPAWRALEKVAPADVLPCENVKGIVERTEFIGLINCPCRAAVRKCDTPVETCLQFNKGGEYMVGVRGVGREIKVSQALALIDRSMELGLVHIALNTAVDPPSLCSCCGDCCCIIEPLKHAGVMAKGLAKSRYEAVVDQEACNGCQTCVDRCQFDAIEMVKSPGSKKLKAAVDSDKCFGCGECVIKCDTGALTLKVVRPPQHILEPGKASLY
ncbi:MAG: 4Fe-4S binding protein [Chloroflexota bacterium]